MGYYIRRVDGVFAVGQIQPKQVVYPPGSRKFRSYMHDRCKVHIYKILSKKQTTSIAEIVKEFPLETEDAIKDTLKTVAKHESGGDYIRKQYMSKKGEAEIQQMVSPEQEVLRQMLYNCYCRLKASGISRLLIDGRRGGGWKREMKRLVFNRDLLHFMDEIKKELEKEKKEWDAIHAKKKKNDANAFGIAHAPMDIDPNNQSLKDTNPSLRLKALNLIEELLFCTSWYLSDQFLRSYRGEGEMQLSGYGNPFKDGQGFNYLHNKDKASSEAIKLMVASAGNRANTKADFRRMAPAKVVAILKQKYGVTDAVLEKLDRRKKMLLLQKKSRDAVSAGSQNKIALRYARLTGSRKVF